MKATTSFVQQENGPSLRETVPSQENTLAERSLRSIRVGEVLGCYDALLGAGEMAVEELAARTGVHERYLRHWLGEQATIGLVEETEPGRYRLASGIAEVFDGEADRPPFRRCLW